MDVFLETFRQKHEMQPTGMHSTSNEFCIFAYYISYFSCLKFLYKKMHWPLDILWRIRNDTYKGSTTPYLLINSQNFYPREKHSNRSSLGSLTETFKLVRLPPRFRCGTKFPKLQWSVMLQWLAPPCRYSIRHSAQPTAGPLVGSHTFPGARR